MENETNHRTIVLDALNPRLQVEQWKCFGCGDWIHHEEVNWALPNGKLTVMDGNPYCDGCLPMENWK